MILDKFFILFSSFRWGSGEPQVDQMRDLSKDPQLDPDAKEGKRTGQILWIRGLTRLQTQVCNKFLSYLCISIADLIISAIKLFHCCCWVIRYSIILLCIILIHHLINKKYLVIKLSNFIIWSLLHYAFINRWLLIHIINLIIYEHYK